jgi:hypothetical protein
MVASDSAVKNRGSTNATISKFMVEDADNVTATTAEETDYDWDTDEDADSESDPEDNDSTEGSWTANPPQHWNLEDPRVTVGLGPPRLQSGERVNGANKRQLRRENKARRIRQQELQREAIFWSDYTENFMVPDKKTVLDSGN